MPNSVTMTYGGSGLSPVPFITWNKQYYKGEDQEKVGAVHNFTLEGHVVNTESGLEGVLLGISDIRHIFSAEGQLFELQCDGNTLFQCYPRIKDLQFNRSADNWTQSCPYSINLEFDIETDNDEDFDLHSPYIKSTNESWEMEFLEDTSYHTFSTSSGSDAPAYSMRVTHNIGAIGVPHYDSTGKIRRAWEEAIDYVDDRLGFDAAKIVGTGTVNLNSANLSGYNHARSQIIDERGGSYSVTESWVVLDPSVMGIPSPVIEDFSVEARINRDEENDTFVVNGEVRGLETVDYGTVPGDYTITEDKYTAASGYWVQVKDDLRIFPRAQTIADLENITLNSNPVTKVITHSPAQGLINYSYTYDDTPSNCITGAKFESIVITDNNPVDVFSQITVLGRPQGPVLQDLNTVSPFTREVSIEITMEKDDDCPAGGISSYLDFGNNPEDQVSNILCDFETDLKSSYGQVFKHTDTKTWDPRRGRYTRQTGWTAVDCSTEVDTNVCNE